MDFHVKPPDVRGAPWGRSSSRVTALTAHLLAKPHGVVDKHTTSKKIACLILGNRPTSRYLIHKLISQSPNIPISTTLIVNKCMPKLFQKGIPLLRIG
jgi:hypothetical protein